MTNRLRVVVVVIVLALVAVTILRFVVGGGEDTWLCQNNTWVKHGKPNGPPPRTGCESKTEAKNAATEQKYKTYTTDDFSITYPYWPDIKSEAIPNPEGIVVAVSNAGCNFVLKATQLPPSVEYKSHIKEQLDEQVSQTGAVIKTSELTERAYRVVAEIPMGEYVLHSESYGYLTKANSTYSAAFVSNSTDFEKICRPFIETVIGSILVK